jgi:hypothetical protein
MSGVVWSKFYWSDWASDPKLRLCSAAAQGLWMRMLCICAEADGYLTIAKRALSSKDLAAITGWPEHDVIGWLDELERWGVYSVDGKGRIYSRRMILDRKKAKTARDNGKAGGNPSLGKQRGSSASVKGRTTPGLSPISHKPRARSQKKNLEADASLSPKGDERPTYPDDFEACWKAYPHIRGRSSKPKAFAQWNRAPLADRKRMDSAISRFKAKGREPNGECGAPAMERWLKDARYLDWLDEAGSVIPFAKPFPETAIRNAVVATKDEAWTASWLDPCGWDPERRVIIPRNGFAAAKIKSEIMRVLAVRQVSIQEMQA